MVCCDGQGEYAIESKAITSTEVCMTRRCRNARVFVSGSMLFEVGSEVGRNESSSLLPDAELFDYFISISPPSACSGA